MISIRFGYVSHAITLWDASPAKTLTYARYQQLNAHERLDKLREITALNLAHTKRMLHYNIAHEIPLYRLSSSIVPLATHPDVKWDFQSPFKNEWYELGKLIKDHHLRVSFHPNQFTLFTSPRQEVTENAVIDMQYHFDMLEAMGLSQTAIINIHIGGAYGDKMTSLKRFEENLKTLPSHIKSRMTLENDDKTYNAEETLAVCEEEKVPMIFDYHHHMANLVDIPLRELLPRVFQTWSHKGLRPKIHVSSPKSDKAYRSHADYVDFQFVQPLLTAIREVGQDVDLMIEAKAKNLACLQLVEDVASIRGVKRVGGGTVEWK